MPEGRESDVAATSRLSTLDASFLEFEDAVTHMHIGSVGVFEGPPPRPEELREMVLGKLSLVPRYRQVVRFVAFGAGRPVWVDDHHFNLDYHLRRTALPAPGGESELRHLVGRVMSQQLDRHKPLWEMWIIEGLDEQRWGLLSKIHHCMVDGVSGTDLITVMLDPERTPEPPAKDSWKPRPEPRGVELLVRSVAATLTSPYELACALAAPRSFAIRGRDAAQGLLRLRDVIRPTPPSSLNGPVGPHRRWGWARTRLSDVKTVRGALGGTVNDIVLAAITGGFRELLISRGESVDRVVLTLVPVSVRSPAEHGVYNNRVSAMFAKLPVGIADPRLRLDAIRAQMADLKYSKEAVAGEVLTSLAGFAPPMLLALAERLGTRVPQHNVNTVTTNVPGPQHPLYAAGRRMLESFPYVPLGGHVRVGVAIFSYDGAVTFGVTGDYDTAADLDVLCEGIERSMAELIELAASDTNGTGSPGPNAAVPASRASANG
ncbi:MAG TPA: wax ester/triacylglycerol synthase family O-acyltransferase [Solirubrobacteraceae bacterium]|nr:wax ester/triacylglycerol synthase family O-acyltransferase [Solirubrobacteraceae bacterium]